MIRTKAVNLTIRTFTQRVDIQARTIIRKAVRTRLVELGGVEQSDATIVGVPLRVLEEVKRLFTEQYPDWKIVEYDHRPHPVIPNGRIAWNEVGTRSDFVSNGYLGRVRVFKVTSHYDYTKKVYETGLWTDLPGVPGSTPRDPIATAETKPEGRVELQETAEKVLETWLKKTGLLETGDA